MAADMIGRVRTWPAALAVILCAAGLFAALGPGYAGYDAAWSLVWGDEIAHGTLPSYGAPVAPTPHPLANVVAIPLSALGDGGEGALVALTFCAFGALLVGAATLGARLSCWPAGIAAALLLATRGLLDREVAFASIDLPFLALVLWAAVLEAGRPRRGAAVLVLLTLAGLLRPEAWVLALAYLAWLATDRGAAGWRRMVALALADLVLTGDPLHSLTGTRELAAELERPTGLSTAASTLPSSVADLTGPLPLVAGLLGLGAGLALAPRRLMLPATVLACGLVTFLTLGVAGLPVLLRYLLVPAGMLAVSAGIGLMLPWHVAPGPARIAAAGVSILIAVLLAASVPRAVREIRDARAFTLARGRVHRDLRALTGEAAFVAAIRRCPQTRVPDFRTRPVLLLGDVTEASRVIVGNLPDGERGLLLTYASERAGTVFTLGAPGDVPLQAVPAGGAIVARNRSWIASAVC
jgi:hypothetical protein